MGRKHTSKAVRDYLAYEQVTIKTSLCTIADLTSYCEEFDRLTKKIASFFIANMLMLGCKMSWSVLDIFPGVLEEHQFRKA